MSMWVFGYGSLLWNPGFEPAERVVASLSGYARSFCMRSIHHRGSEEEPGLVLALDEAEGEICHGVALRVAPGEEAPVLADLRERELISSAYVERHVPLRMEDGRVVEALAYVIDRDHVQYCHLTLEVQAQIIARAVGGRGPNDEYLFNTAALLRDLRIEDADLNWLSLRVQALKDAR
ncbi:gamma-glutamylcyclotransferase [Poseidonocella sedimentorum]|uniref:glutathione-specific gamma-glutamylcyclotransferase n=1 Tax=Poseidonocella sedimentorum TaxID=871652 RepID=A0A1I6DXY8_9RHOB|nr:gamma-glutamylcyclotransferase [Poseidonocella sedimentorum]SFR10247.1 cation transport protein ChaC [Poseidonocella sedimentorum]